MAIIILVSAILGVELILLIIDTVLLYQLHRNREKVKNEANQTEENILQSKTSNRKNEEKPSIDKEIMEKEEEKEEKASAIVIGVEGSDDDDAIEDKFQKRRKKAKKINLMLDINSEG